jgi:hypothetical protein
MAPAYYYDLWMKQIFSIWPSGRVHKVSLALANTWIFWPTMLFHVLFLVIVFWPSYQSVKTETERGIEPGKDPLGPVIGFAAYAV